MSSVSQMQREKKSSDSNSFLKLKNQWEKIPDKKKEYTKFGIITSQKFIMIKAKDKCYDKSYCHSIRKLIEILKKNLYKKAIKSWFTYNTK